MNESAAASSSTQQPAASQPPAHCTSHISSVSRSIFLSTLCIFLSPSSLSLLSHLSSRMSSNSNDAKRDAQEGGNRLSEDLEHGLNKVKRAIVGGSGASDTASETAHHTQNKVGEVANRIVSNTRHTPHAAHASRATASAHLTCSPPLCASVADVVRLPAGCTLARCALAGRQAERCGHRRQGLFEVRRPESEDGDAVPGVCLGVTRLLFAFSV